MRTRRQASGEKNGPLRTRRQPCDEKKAGIKN